MKKCTSHWYCQPNEKRILLEIDTLNKKIWLYSPPKRMRSWHELIEPRIFVKRMFFLDPWQQKLQNTPKHTSNDVDKSHRSSHGSFDLQGHPNPPRFPTPLIDDVHRWHHVYCGVRGNARRRGAHDCARGSGPQRDATLDTWQKRLSLALSIKYSIYMIM